MTPWFDSLNVKNVMLSDFYGQEMTDIAIRPDISNIKDMSFCETILNNRKHLIK